eukprot:7048856-Pyramimonas_sp.AAC.2
MFRARKVSGGSVGHWRMRSYVGRSAMMYCPPRGFGYSLRLCFPSATAFQALPVSRASLVSTPEEACRERRQAAAGCSRP